MATYVKENLQATLKNAIFKSAQPALRELQFVLNDHTDALCMDVSEFNKAHGMQTQIEQMFYDVDRHPEGAIAEWCESLVSFSATIQNCDSNYYGAQMDYESGMLEAVSLTLQVLERSVSLLKADKDAISAALEVVYPTMD